MEMKPLLRIQPVVFIGIFLFLLEACTTPTPTPTQADVIAVTTPLSQQVTLTSISYNETGQMPLYSITADTPMFSGSEDTRVQDFNKKVNNIIQDEITYFKINILNQQPLQPVAAGSSFAANYEVIFRRDGIWSLRFSFTGHEDSETYTYHYSKTLNYDLEQGQEISISDLFPENSDYLKAISKYCIAELTKRDVGFYGGFQKGAAPKPDNYRNWNITDNGLMITFDEYQVAPYNAGQQVITIPYTMLQPLIKSKSLLATFIP